MTMIRDAMKMVVDGRIRRWTVRGSWAVLDQAIFASSNFILNIMLARWLPPREYGAFVTAYAILLLIHVANASLFIEPMFVYGPGKYADRFTPYFRLILRYLLVFMAIVAACLLLAGAALRLFGVDLLDQALLGLAVSGPLILLNWFTRGVCYIEDRPGLATKASAIYMAGALTGASVLYALGLLGVVTVQLLMGACALAASAPILHAVLRTTRETIPAHERAAVWGEHVQFGRWSGASGLVAWSHGSVFYLLLPVWHGLEAAAVLRAVMNFIQPILHANSALSTLLAPQLARLRDRPAGLLRIFRWSTRLFLLQSFVYWMALVVFREPLVQYTYGPQYAVDADLLIVLGGVALLESQVNLLRVRLRVFERTDLLFWATAGTAVVSLVVGLPMMILWSVTGALWATVLTGATLILLMSYYLNRILADATQSPARPQEPTEAVDGGGFAMSAIPSESQIRG